MDIKNLIEKAAGAAKIAYSPYSKYCVGTALLTKSGEIFTGCNVENASYGATNCAERTAFFKAVSEGFLEFEAIAIVGGPSHIICTEDAEKEGNHIEFSDYAYPCGICRQVMQEFCDRDFRIIVAKSVEDYKEYTLGELLPFGFGGIVKVQ
jgi:cytidine deaminase